jgi:drug/metabolite transporter (DMT)-like permease
MDRKNLQERQIMLKGASVGLLVLGIVFITQAETRLVGIFWLLAAAALAGWEWRRRNRAGKPATSAEANAQGPPGPGQ